jgi:membrane-associated phospholipid phosphatase
VVGLIRARPRAGLPPAPPRPFTSRLGLALVLASLTIGSSARADDGQVDRITPSYFWDRDAMVFFWAPLAGTLVMDSWVSPRDQPLGFDTAEGGKESRRGGEVPGVALSIGGAMVVGGIAAGDDPSRFHHAKGLAQSLATSGFIAVSAKRLFGRQRPDFDSTSPTEDGRRSFPSGHSTRALSTITYAALYLRYHGFDQWREPGTLPWWEVASYAGLGALAIGLTGERVYHHRHHVGDVIVGGLLGAASSTLFFYYQESRYRRAASSSTMPPAEPRLFADERAPVASLPAPDGPMLSFGGAF